MRAIVCSEWGGPENLEVADVEAPAMRDGGVRIAVKAAGVNFADTLIIKGEYQIKPEPPFSPGLEVAGTVLECAASETRFRPGDRVMANLNYGGWAEEAVAEASDVHPIPDEMDFEAAATFPIVYGTSHVGLKNKLALAAGETLLVNGAAGGVGLTAVELGKAMGATVIASVGGREKLAIAAEYGADHLIDYRKEDIRSRVKELTGGRGAEAVYDPVGGDAFTASLRAAAPMGRILVVGFASGTVPQIPANLLLVKNLSVIGYYWGAHRKLDSGLLTASFTELFDMYRAGKIRPHISHRLELADAAKALELLRDRKSTGKVVLWI